MTLNAKHVDGLYAAQGAVEDALGEEQLFSTREALIEAQERLVNATEYVAAEVSEQATGLKS